MKWRGKWRTEEEYVEGGGEEERGIWQEEERKNE